MEILRPIAAYPRTSGISGGFNDSGGSPESGFGNWLAIAGISTDEILELWFRAPLSLPAGTAKLAFHATANADQGFLQVNPKWASFATEESIQNPTLSPEGGAALTWLTGDQHQIKELKVVLDAVPVVAGEWILMHLTLEAASTLGQVAGFDASIIFE